VAVGSSLRTSEKSLEIDSKELGTYPRNFYLILNNNMEQKLLDILACPKCKGDLELKGDHLIKAGSWDCWIIGYKR